MKFYYSLWSIKSKKHVQSALTFRVSLFGMTKRNQRWTPLGLPQSVRGQTPMNPGFIARSGGRPKLWTINRSIFLNLMKFLISWFDTSGSLISLVEFNKWILRAFEFIHNFKLEIYADYVQFTKNIAKKQSSRKTRCFSIGNCPLSGNNLIILCP